MPFCAAQIVYSNSWINQSGNIPQVTLINPQTNGVYRAYALYPNFPGGTINYNFDASGYAFISDGTAFTFSVVPTDPNATYSFWIVIEQLQ